MLVDETATSTKDSNAIIVATTPYNTYNTYNTWQIRFRPEILGWQPHLATPLQNIKIVATKPTVLPYQHHNMLKDPLLPQLVEERRQRENGYESETQVGMTEHTEQDISLLKRGHVRASSSHSSLDRLSMPTAEIPSSPPPSGPSFVANGAAGLGSKTALPDVQEEPMECEIGDSELEGFEMVDDRYDVYDWSCASIALSPPSTSMCCVYANRLTGDDAAHNSYEDGIGNSSVQLSAQPDIDYDLADGFLNDANTSLSSFASTPTSTGRKRAHSDSPFANIADRLSTRFPGFSRKWRTRKDSNPLPPLVTSMSESNTRAPSTRSSSVSASVHKAPDITISYNDAAMPPTPSRSEVANDAMDSVRTSIDILGDEGRPAKTVTTPLLPPMMKGLSASSADNDVPLQSPLQSPSVADQSFEFSSAAGTNSLYSLGNTRVNSPLATHSHTPSLLPSPPLSTKPSISSMRPVTVYPLSHTAHPSQLLGLLSPATESPVIAFSQYQNQILGQTGSMNQAQAPAPIILAEDDDKWAQILGHANFTIYPESYMPDLDDASTAAFGATLLPLDACKKLREDWDSARTGFMRHLVRTGEHYGDRSEVYRNTEEKWREVDEMWRNNFKVFVQLTAQNLDTDEESVNKMLNQGGAGGGTEEKNMEINIPRFDQNKWVEMGDEDIVGPMERVERSPERAEKCDGEPRSSSKKARLRRFFSNMVGGGAGSS